MNMNEKEIKKDLATTSEGIIQNNDSEYVRLVSQISGLWEKAKEKAAFAVNTELLKASWETGRYIVEYEQHGSVKAEYGKQKTPKSEITKAEGIRKHYFENKNKKI